MNAITTNLGNFQVTRTTVNKKTGAEINKVRDALGVIASGNRKERDAATRFMVIHYFTSGQFKPLAQQLDRAFGKTFAGFVPHGFDVATGLMSKDGNTWNLSNRQAWEGIVNSMLKVHAEKPFKGERGLFCAVLGDALATYAAQQAQKEAEAKQAADEHAAALAAGLVAGVVDTTATVVQAPALPAPDALTSLFDADDAEGSAPAGGEGEGSDGDGFAVGSMETVASVVTVGNGEGDFIGERVNADAEVIA